MFYIAPDQSLMSVAIHAGVGGFHVGAPAHCSRRRIAPIRSISRQQYAVSPDAQRFLINTTDQAPPTPLTLILNWKPGRNVAPDGVPR